MKRSFYPRLALDGLRKNRRMSGPYLLTCICMVAMHYILGYLTTPTALRLLPKGRATVETVLNLGGYVVLLFSLVFLFYTHSFLIRSRQREFGLYNVLGMGKRDLTRICTWETFITFALAMAGGLAMGVALSKLAELCLVDLLHGEVDYRLRLDAGPLLKTLICYAAIFMLIWLSAVIRTARTSAIGLINANRVGEKPPKGNGLLALAGVALLGAAYWMAVSIGNPLDAILWFFVAVLMVIVATYLIMIAGSVKLCHALQGNKRYYYDPRHFVSVSSMAYRMKRNGAGLASICVIATMVLVMLSTTTCLWFGTEDSILKQYPREINLDVRMNDLSQLDDANLDRFRGTIAEYTSEQAATVDNVRDFRYVYLAGMEDGDEIQCDVGNYNGSINYSRLWEIYVVSADDYAAKTGAPVNLSDGEAKLLVERGSYPKEVLTLSMGGVSHHWRVASVEKGALVDSFAGLSLPCMTVIVEDLAAAVEGFAMSDENGASKLQITWVYGFDTGLIDEKNSRFGFELEERLGQLPFDGEGGQGYRAIFLRARADGAADFYGLNGGLFFIGIVLSAVFLAAAVLIIYYKQVSEGYEDVKRFDIMQKVGMTKREIRASISSQLLTVFALPLAFAALHLSFAFPMIQKLLTLFSLYNVGLFARTTLISLAAFAALYAVVYRLTSGVYYRIVSGAEK